MRVEDKNIMWQGLHPEEMLKCFICRIRTKWYSIVTRYLRQHKLLKVHDMFFGTVRTWVWM